MNADTITYAVVKRQLNLRHETLSSHIEANDESGAREALASILWVVNNIPEKQYRYKDLAEYTLDFYRKCLRQTLSAGIELDSSYFTARGELLCIK